MSNTFITADKVAELAVTLLRRDLVLPNTVQQVGSDTYSGSAGVALVRVPARRAARTYTSGNLTYDAIEEGQVAVTVARVYSGFTLTVNDSTLEIVDFANQVLAPSLGAVIEASEQSVADAMNATTTDNDFSWQDLTDPDKTKDDLLQLREILSTNLNPQADRYIAASPSVVTALLRIPNLAQVNQSGSDQAIRTGSIPTTLGFTINESAALEADSAVAYHRSGYIQAQLAPEPSHSGQSSTINQEGVALRVTFGWDSSTGGDVGLIDTFAGSSLVREEDDTVKRAVRVTAGS